MRRARPAGRHRMLHWLLVSALLLRSVVPLGYMPADVDGELGMVFCDEHGASTELIAEDPGRSAEHGGVPCLFGFAVGMAAAPAMPPSLAAPLMGDAGPTHLHTAFDAQHVCPDHRARAPPRLLI